MIAVIDYGAGNLRSVKNALDSLGAANMRASTAKEILLADAVILPGVGEFGSAKAALERRGSKEAVQEALRRRGSAYCRDACCASRRRWGLKYRTWAGTQSRR